MMETMGERERENQSGKDGEMRQTERQEKEEKKKSN